MQIRAKDVSFGDIQTIDQLVPPAVGGSTRECNGHLSSWGQQSGEWKEVDFESCRDNEFATEYYVFCNGQWIQVSSVDCPCS
ncbi:MAG TPA: hypothetical protein VGR02_16010 [Thermoanaerobaculia bacterium]|jgi:hypothetical protein|nr:hypothetical protein [Thermoanaerobaculia bacterium]